MYEDVKHTFPYFGSLMIENFDLYYIAHANMPISKENRKALKESGWRCQRHSRSNKEIWVFDKKQ
jgi:hypothetical protein